MLARLAVYRTTQGTGLGEKLLLAVFQCALLLAQEVGIWCLEVDALHEQAAAFYARFGFERLGDSPLHLYLPTATIRNSLREDA